MRTIKDLYQSRHYAQCAKYGERLLTEVHDVSRIYLYFMQQILTDTQIEPAHLAYLNFYTALSHDTLAREATLKNRYKSLKLAELYYAAAIAALAPSNMINLKEEETSPAVSPTANMWKRRSSNANSFDSTSSAASSTTSYGGAEHMPTPKQLTNFRFPQPPSRPQTPQEFHFATSTYSFLLRLQGHLTSIQEFKEKIRSPTSVRFTFPTPPSTSAPQGSSRLSAHTRRTSRMIDFDDEEMKEETRQRRREIVWRQRFDPENVQRLCTEALNDLR